MHTCWIKGVLALIAIVFAWIKQDVLFWAPYLVTLAIILMFVAKDGCQDCNMNKVKTAAPRKVVRAKKKNSKRRRR